MKAYNSTTIFNASIKQKSENWFAKNLISEQQYQSISNHYSNEFYTPNVFIKIVLFVFISFIILATVGMYSLMVSALFSVAGNMLITVSCLMFAGACFFVLETLIKHKNFYNAGADEALLYAGLLFITGALFWITYSFHTESTLLIACLLFPFLAIAVLRYADKIITLVLCICAYTILFLIVMELGEISKMIMPFVLMAFSALLYFQTKKLKNKPSLYYWHSCIEVVQYISLIIFYMAGNYFIIRESSLSFFDLNLEDGQDVPLAILFYIFTAIVPIIYIYFGLKRKEKTLLWSGLILLAASAITFKYYFILGNAEIYLTIAGIILILVAYFSIQYFKIPKHGITFEEEKDANSFLKSNAEALIILEGLAPTTPGASEDGFEFGGGESGGAGSGGSY